MRRRNLNRYRKVYPGILKTPKFVTEFEGTLEVGTVTFSGETIRTYTFTETYERVPSVVLTLLADSGNEHLANTPVYIYSITNSSVTIATGAEFIGTVQVQVISI